MENGQRERDNLEDRQKKRASETVKIVLLSLLWFCFIILSLYTYYAIPLLVFVSWWIIAWLFKKRKKDKHDGSPYDEEAG